MLQLVDALGWCLDLGITCVSVYAFSIDNFKRSEAEVAALMDLAEDKLQELLQVGWRLATAARGPTAMCMDLAIDNLHELRLQVGSHGLPWLVRQCAVKGRRWDEGCRGRGVAVRTSMLASGRGPHQYAVTSADGCTCGSMQMVGCSSLQAAGQDCAGGQQTCRRASCMSPCKPFQLFGLEPVICSNSITQPSLKNSSVTPCAVDTEGWRMCWQCAGILSQADSTGTASATRSALHFVMS